MSANLTDFQKITIPASNKASSSENESIYEWQTVGKYYSEAEEAGPMAMGKDEDGNIILYVGGGISRQDAGWKTTFTYNQNFTSRDCKGSKYNLTTDTYSDLNDTAFFRAICGAGGIWNGYFYASWGLYPGSSNTNNYYAWPYAHTGIMKIDTNGSNTNLQLLSLPQSLFKPAYCQNGSKLYIFGGAVMTNTKLGQGTSGVTELSQDILNTLNADNRKAYVFDMETETMTGLPDLPITGGRYVSICAYGDYIYIRNLTQFCRLNLLTSEYEMLPPFQEFTEIYDTPEIIYYNMDGADVILSMSGSLSTGYGECYNIGTNTISDWNYPCYPSQRFKLFNIDNTLYMVYGSMNVETNHGLGVLKMVKKESQSLEVQPIVAKIPSGAYYHGLNKLEIPDLNLTINTTQQLATQDYYIKKGMYSYPTEYTIYLESKNDSSST